MELYSHKWCWIPRSTKFSSCPGKYQNLHKLVLADCKFNLHEIAKELKIQEDSVFIILHEDLLMRKLCSKWVSRLLTIYQKQCVNNKYVTMDETWIHHFPLESNLSQLSGHQQVKAVQSDQRCKHQQARFWPPYFGMCKVLCSSITLRKEEPSIVNII